MKRLTGDGAIKIPPNEAVAKMCCLHMVNRVLLIVPMLVGLARWQNH